MVDPVSRKSLLSDRIKLFCQFAFLWFAILFCMPVSTALAATEAHLRIPKIKVDAVIKDMGLTSQGTMAVPGNGSDVGWFSLGTRPSEIGSAVIGGHNRWNSRSAVFAHLDQLQKGDVIYVVDVKGVSTSFIVQGTHTYNATDANSGIFESTSGSHLNLITCSGVFNPLIKDYSKRLVVFTDAVPAVSEIAMLQS